MFGFVIVTIGVMLGGICTMLLARYLFRKTIRKRFLSKLRSFQAIDKVLTNEGWKTIFLLRITPIPFSITSYILGVSSVKLRDFTIGTLSVMVHIALWIYIG
jgi:uncharacterized membrane protein YdjX (TVP38/TMEM64 family)